MIRTGSFVSQDRFDGPTGLAEFSTHAVVFQRNSVEVATDFGIHARVIEVRECSSAGEHVRLSVVGRFHGNIGIAIQAGTGWNELTDDDVLLQTKQWVSSAFHCGLREDASGFLEGCGREPRVRSQRGLGNTHELVTTACWAFAFCNSRTVGSNEPSTVS